MLNEIEEIKRILIENHYSLRYDKGWDNYIVCNEYGEQEFSGDEKELIEFVKEYFI